MDIAVVKNALGSLDKVLSQAKQALRDIERERRLAIMALATLGDMNIPIRL
jgi:hypothetical protein